MAPLPRPIGIDRTLVDIATGIGASAKLLPELSRSDIGAVAVKTARVRIEFDMARLVEKTADGVSLGVRSFGIGARMTSENIVSKSSNHGIIDLEIVAIVPAEPVPERPPPDNDRRPDNDRKQREAIVRAIALLKLPEARAELDPGEGKELDELLRRAEEALAAGDLAAAAGYIQQIEQLLEAASQRRATVVPAGSAARVEAAQGRKLNKQAQAAKAMPAAKTAPVARETPATKARPATKRGAQPAKKG